MVPIESGWIPAVKIHSLLQELIQRCGSPEQAAEYAGLGTTTVYEIFHLNRKRVQKKTAHLVILALYERRKEDRRNGQSEAFRHARIRQAMMEERMLDLIGY